MVGVGFAFTENILYLASAYDGSDGSARAGSQALTGLFVLRCLVSPFAHPLFTAFTGIGVGIAVELPAPRRRASLAPLVRVRLRRARPRDLEHLDRLRPRRTS